MNDKTKGAITSALAVFGTAAVLYLQTAISSGGTTNWRNIAIGAFCAGLIAEGKYWQGRAHEAKKGENQ